MVDVQTVRRWLRIIKESERFLDERRMDFTPAEYSVCNHLTCGLQRIHDELQAAVTVPLEIEQ